MKSPNPIAIIGAGPYGLSLAAHLRARGVPFRIFGHPMRVWQTQMPRGMYLKSDGFASDLYDPDRRFTLKRYCRERGISYADYGTPISLDTFVAYGLEFQKSVVPMLEAVCVTAVRRVDSGYLVQLDTKESVAARAVVIATGISYFAYVPEPLDRLPAELCTHSSAHHDLTGFRGRRVVVIGGGSSATDIAALLCDCGASVRLVSRRPLKFHLPPDSKPRTLWQRIRAPNLGLGPGLRSAFYTAAPGLFRWLPGEVRRRVVRHHLGPAGGWFIREKVTREVEVHTGYAVRTATPGGRGVALRFSHEDTSLLDIEADHVIAATGYRPSVARLSFLDPQLRAEVAVDGDSPALSGSFESSVPGLYFIGVASANCFGPLMRFARGAEYTADRLGGRLDSIHGESTAKERGLTASD